MNKIKPIAIYLPQFHPFKENDEWWGKGFTEWTNVTKAKPLFKGHYQPHLPADLGFYDLRLNEARLAQEALAKEYGIYGFCYYHYWFNGKRLLHEPLNRKLKNPKEDFPFMLCWANENWTRRWDGQDSDLLIEQNYSLEDDIEHIRFLCKEIFCDSRYIRVNGKPFFIIYRPSLFPDINNTLRIWRKEALKLGIGELYIGFMNSFGEIYDFDNFNMDVCVEFAPHFSSPKKLYGSKFNIIWNKLGNIKNAFFHKLGNKNLINFNNNISNRIAKSINNPYNENHITDYEKLVESQLKKKFTKRTYPSLYPMWDNSARKKGKNSYMTINNTPLLYGKWLCSIIKRFKPFSEEENFIFINAWNEWGEGNHLEPCQKWGKQYLEVTKRILNDA